MLQVKTHGSNAGWALPEQLFGEIVQKRVQLFASLQERVRNRLKQRWHARQRAAQPHFAGVSWSHK